MQLIFNELSLKDIPEEVKQGETVFEQFVLAYNQAIKKNYGFSREIITCIDLNNIEIAKNYYVAQWRNNPKTDMDLANRFRGICDRQIISEMAENEVELSCCKGIGKGLLSAHENNNVAISLATHSVWNNFFLKACFYNLADDSIFDIEVYNLTDANQLNIYSTQLEELKSVELVDYKTGVQLLEDIHKLFPSLIFHKNAKDQLKNEVEPQHIPAICKKLLEIEKYFNCWDGKEFKESDFKTKISPESKTTLDMFRKVHTFTFDKKEVLVSYHLRYTGNIPGRIYFYPDNDTGKGLICSLTTKIKNVTDKK